MKATVSSECDNSVWRQNLKNGVINMRIGLDRISIFDRLTILAFNKFKTEDSCSLLPRRRVRTSQTYRDMKPTL